MGRDYPNSNHERSIYWFEDVYEEVRWHAIMEYLRYKESIDLGDDAEEDDVGMRLGSMGYNMNLIVKDIPSFIQEYFKQAIVEKC